MATHDVLSLLGVMMPNQAHDRLFKTLLRDRRAACALLGFGLPAGVLAGVEPQSLRAADPELFAGRRRRVADRLIVVRARGRLLHVLVEHQTRPEPEMHLRLLDEILAFARRSQRGRPRARPLPLVVPLVVYQGRRPWPAADDLRERFDAPAALRPLVPALRHALIDLHRTSDEALPDPPALRLGLRLLKHACTRDPWPVLLACAPQVRAVLDERGLDGLCPFLDYATEIARAAPPIDFPRQLALAAGYPLREVFMGYAAQLRREGRQEGRQEGRHEGRQEGQLLGQRALLRRLLERRFGPLTADQVDRLNAAELAQIEGWTDRLLAVASAEELFEGG